jgi:hypothetical protein
LGEHSAEWARVAAAAKCALGGGGHCGEGGCQPRPFALRSIPTAPSHPCAVGAGPQELMASTSAKAAAGLAAEQRTVPRAAAVRSLAGAKPGSKVGGSGRRPGLTGPTCSFAGSPLALRLPPQAGGRRLHSRGAQHVRAGVAGEAGAPAPVQQQPAPELPQPQAPVPFVNEAADLETMLEELDACGVSAGGRTAPRHAHALPRPDWAALGPRGPPARSPRSQGGAGRALERPPRLCHSPCLLAADRHRPGLPSPPPAGGPHRQPEERAQAQHRGAGASKLWLQ